MLSNVDKSLRVDLVAVIDSEDPQALLEEKDDKEIYVLMGVAISCYESLGMQSPDKVNESYNNFFLAIQPNTNV